MLNDVFLVSEQIAEKHRAQLEEEKKRIFQDKTIAEEEKEKLMKQKEKKLAELKKQKDAKEKLSAKIEV